MNPTRMLFAIFTIAILFAGAAGDLSATEYTPWFDMENCAMCAPIRAEEGLMEHMHWDTHKLATGMISVTTVDPEFVAKYEHAEQEMMGLGMKLASGEKMHLCGQCQSINDLMAAGAKMDNFKTGADYVMAITATDPELIAKIHAHVDRHAEELAKLGKMEEQKQ